MGSYKRYDQEYKYMIIELYKSGIAVTEVAKEYEIANSTTNGWINMCKEIKDKCIEFIKNNSHQHNINTMCSVLGITRSTYYKKLTGQEPSRSKEIKVLKY